MRCENLDVWKRSSLSVASNIAEGMEKDSYKDKIRFLNIAEGSIAELITQIYIGIEIRLYRKDSEISVE
jgi:four helix bundle protein